MLQRVTLCSQQFPGQLVLVTLLDRFQRPIVPPKRQDKSRSHVTDAAFFCCCSCGYELLCVRVRRGQKDNGIGRWDDAVPRAWDRIKQMALKS